MKIRHHRKAQQALQARLTAHRAAMDAYWCAVAENDIEDYDDGLDCTKCGGRGLIESDDPFWDDADEFGEIECWACSGTGDREHQTIF